MSTIYTRYYPENYGAGSGLIWLGDVYTYEQASGLWPNVRWSYMYSGYTELGAMSDYSFIKISGAMSEYWNSYSGMYTTDSGCRWTSEFYETSGFGTNLAFSVTSEIGYQVHGVRIYYSGTYGLGIGNTQSFTNPGDSYAYILTVSGPGTHSGIVELPPGESYTNNTGGSQSVFYSGVWSVSEGSESVPSNFGGAMLFMTPDSYIEGIGVVETRHTYSGAPEEAYKEWTQDAAAVMEAYERTLGTYAFHSSTTGSGIHWAGAYGCPPLFKINPGLYYVGMGNIWFHSTCDIDAQGAKFVGKKATTMNVGQSATWRTPTGDQAKAVITYGADYYIKPGPSTDQSEYKGSSYCQESSVHFPHIMQDTGETSGNFGSYTGAGIRLLRFYNCRLYNINILGPTRYGLLVTPDGTGSSYDRIYINKIVNFLSAFKFRLRDSSTNTAWFGNNVFQDGWIQEPAPSAPWDPYLNPNSIFENDNSIENPNRDTREDLYYVDARPDQPQFGDGVDFWMDNVATEAGNIMQFIRASGWSNIVMTKGRFELMDKPIVHPVTGENISRQWWLRGKVGNVRFEDNRSTSLAQGIPLEFLGRGIDSIQHVYNFPGTSDRLQTRYQPYQDPTDTREKGPSTHGEIQSVSHDLFINRPGGMIQMLNESQEKLRAMYIEDIVDPVGGKTYPVVKAKTFPYLFLKWKLDSEPDSAYSNAHRVFPVGSTIHFKFGDFESLPDNGSVGNYRPKISTYMYFRPNGSEDDTSFFPSGLIDGIAGKGASSTYDDWYVDNANIINGDYVEAAYTFENSGIAHLGLLMRGYEGGTSYPENYYEYTQLRQYWAITIS